MSRSDEFKALGAKIEKGGAPKYHEKNAEAGKLFAASASRCSSTTAADFVEDGLLANNGDARAPRRRRGHRPRQDARAHGRDHGQRLDGEGRLVGRAHRREDPPHPGDRRRACGCRSSTWSTRPARASPIRSTCSPAAAAPGASSTTRCSCPARCRRSACSSGRRRPAAPTSRRSATWCSWSTGTRPCTSARRAWRRWSSARRSRSRRWAARACTARSPAAATCWSRRGGAHRRRARLPRATCRSARARRRRRARRAAADADGKRIDEIIPADQNKSFDMCAVIDELVDEGSFFEIKKLFAQEIVTGFARIDGRVGRHRRQPAQVEGRRALRRLGRQGRALHLAVRRVRASRCSSWPTCPAS